METPNNKIGLWNFRVGREATAGIIELGDGFGAVRHYELSERWLVDEGAGASAAWLPLR